MTKKLKLKKIGKGTSKPDQKNNNGKERPPRICGARLYLRGQWGGKEETICRKVKNLQGKVPKQKDSVGTADVG